MNILLVEDDEVDAEAVRRQLAPLAESAALTVVSNGVKALNVLRGQPPHFSLMQPYLILLDLKMPEMDGYTFLRELRSDPALRMSLVFVLSHSDSDAAKSTAYRCGIAGFISKSNLKEIAKLLTAYIALAEFPPLDHEPPQQTHTE